MKLEGESPKVVRLEVHGAKEVKAKDIQVPSDVEILNPEHHIATVGDDGHLVMEITLDKGRGYVSAEKNKRPDDVIGVIPVDSIFTPVKKVNYVVEHTRVGQFTDSDRLVLEIWTDGSMTRWRPLLSADLSAHLALFINLSDKVTPRLYDEGRLKTNCWR